MSRLLLLTCLCWLGTALPLRAEAQQAGVQAPGEPATAPAAETDAAATPVPAEAPAPQASPQPAPLPDGGQDAPDAASEDEAAAFPAQATDTAGPPPEAPAQEPEVPEASTGSPAPAETWQPPPLSAHVGLGGGMGMRSFRRPTPVGLERLDPVHFPTVDLELRVRGALRQRLSLELQMAYQSSLGLAIESRPAFALPVAHDARSEHAELSLAPIVHLGDSETAPALAARLGLGLRSFVPAVSDQPTPAFYLAGPLLRIEAQLQLAPPLTLRLGPQLSWLLAISDSLREDGVSGSGLALGLQGELSLQLLERFELAACYRESVASVDHENRADEGPSFRDRARSVTLKLTGRVF
ncbi:MAG: hypothetical protein OEZ06_08350 [Myxococcales bacterium]|nr:hypothetical protein [Myxococcales bacterium]